MSKPIVAVVGRPNVGKSTFFNRVAGKRISIVEDKPGVTRDRIYAEAEWNGKKFDLIDTGGLEPSSKDMLLVAMRDQAQTAMDMADVILFMVDGKDGVTSADAEVASMLRRTGKEVVLVVNKIDAPHKVTPALYDFYELGIGEPLPVSSVNMLGLGDVLDRLTEAFPQGEDEEEEAIRVAVIGKPNVGKSSLVNALVQENRVIVSPLAGTTRDAIDTPFVWDDENFLLIDTAGIRRRSKVYEDVERYSVIRSIAAIERADVCLLLIDATEGLSEQDMRIAGEAHEAGKGIVLVVNKWDLVKKETDTMRDFEQRLRADLQFISYAPVVFASALSGQRLERVMQEVKSVADSRAVRISTGQLNSLIADAVMTQAPPADKGRRLKIYYATQVGVKPPLFSFSINDRALLHFSYSRYLENRIRAAFGFRGTSIKFVFRERGKEE